MNTAIAIFAFNRADHLLRMFQSLERCEGLSEFDVYVFVDGPRNKNDEVNVSETVKVIKERTEINFKNIEIKEKNKGLANSIIQGVTSLFESYEAVIVLEDDLTFSPYFLSYMKKMLLHFNDKKEIYSISGYSYPRNRMKIKSTYDYDVFFSYRPHSWGWATWKDRWAKAIWELDGTLEVFTNPKESEKFNRGGSDLTEMLHNQLLGRINSWAIRWAYTHYKFEKLAVYPIISFVENHGFDGSGTHCKKENFQKNFSLNKKEELVIPETIRMDEQILAAFRNVFEPPKPKIGWKQLIRYALKKVKELYPTAWLS